VNLKAVHEDEAFEDLLHFLRLQGAEAEIVSRPDRDRSDPLTVDAILRWDGALMAVDHCLLSRPADLVPAADRGKAELTRLLQPIAVESGRLLLVSFQPQVGVQGARWGEHYYRCFVELARMAVAADQQAELSDGISAVRAVLPPQGGEPGVGFLYVDDITGTGLISAQVDAGIREALLSKLNKQLRKAKTQGYWTGLLVDQQPRPGRHSSIWPARPETVAAVVRDLIAEHERDNPHVLDVVWFRATRRLDADRCDVHCLIQGQF
jgi:hypothetical protein